MVQDVLEKIAKGILRIDSLETRNSDELDFHEVSVWSLKLALQCAYQEGKRDGENSINSSQ